MKEKCIIVEIIPTTRSKDTGVIAQISALKLDGMKLIDRFDYRLKGEHVRIPDILAMISYDKDKFNYVNTNQKLIDDFSTWSENLPLLILDNEYTNSYLSDLSNEKRSICDLLNMNYQDDIIEKLIDKYHLEPSNYIVDLLYESILNSDLNSD